LNKILQGSIQEIIPASIGLIWLSGFRREDFHMTSCQNQPN